MTAVIIRRASRLIFTASLSLLAAATLAAHPSWGIVVSSTGIVYFSDLETVWKIDRDGKVSVFRPGVSGRHVHELSIDSQGNVFGPITVYDAATQKYLVGVWKMTPDGKEAVLQSPVDSVMSGVSIWRDNTGNMYSVEQNNNLKQRTLLLKRTPDGSVSTLAGGAYGYADGQGAAARFSGVYAMTFGRDGNLYLTDGTYVRRATLDGVVTTVAKDLAARTSEDKPTLFGGDDKILAGVAVDSGGNVYVADAGNRRLVKIGKDGKLGVVYRLDPPYFPTGVFATANGDVYVLEFSYTPPGTTDRPRVRRISSDGQNQILISFLCPPYWQCGTDADLVKSRGQSIMGFVNTGVVYIVLFLVVVVFSFVSVLWWRRRRRLRA
jgi:hypothetical protein